MKLLLALVAAGATGTATAPRRYDVRLEVVSGGRSVAQPRLLVAEGEAARFAVDDGRGAGWSASVTPTAYGAAHKVGVAWSMTVTRKKGDTVDSRRVDVTLGLQDPGTARFEAPTFGHQAPFAIRLHLASAAAQPSPAG